MGLLNVYQMREMRPYINYRFKCNIWGYEGNFAPAGSYFEYTVKKVKLPTFKLDTENKISFGNTAYVIPIINFADTSLDITFEEDENMSVFEMLCGFYGNNIFNSAKMKLICIKVDQFDETMMNRVDSKLYLCRLKEFSQPNFNNNGRGAPVEITASFNVVYIYQGDAKDSGFKYEKDVISRPDDEDIKYFTDEMKAQSKKAEEVYKKKEEEQKQKMLKYAQEGYAKYKNKAVTNLHKKTLDKEKEKLAAADDALNTYTNDVFNKIIAGGKNDKRLQEWSNRINQGRISVPGEKPKTDFEILADILDVDLSDGIDSSEKNSLLEFYGDNEERTKLLSIVMDKYSDAKINTNILSEAEQGKEETALKTVFENNDQSYDEALLREEMELANAGGTRASGSGLRGLTKADRLTGKANGQEYTVDIVGSKDYDINGNTGTIFTVDGHSFDQSGKVARDKPIGVMYIHMQAAMNTSIDYAIMNTNTQGITTTFDQYGNGMFNLDYLYKDGAGLGKDVNGKGVVQKQPSASVELPGYVDLEIDESGKYYARTSTGREGVDRKEITEAEFLSLVGEEYTKETMKGNKNLESSVKRTVDRDQKVLRPDGTVDEVKITKVFDSKATDNDLMSLYRLGQYYSENNIAVSEDVQFMSHGMGIAHGGGKLEGGYEKMEQYRRAFLAGYNKQTYDSTKFRK